MWTKSEIDIPQFRHFEKVNGGRLLGQGWKTIKGKLFELYYLVLYAVDDGAFMFMDRRDIMIKRAVSCIHQTSHAGPLWTDHAYCWERRMGNRRKLRECITLHHSKKNAKVGRCIP
jgi:hypothetical protein